MFAKCVSLIFTSIHSRHSSDIPTWADGGLCLPCPIKISGCNMGFPSFHEDVGLHLSFYTGIRWYLKLYTNWYSKIGLLWNKYCILLCDILLNFLGNFVCARALCAYISTLPLSHMHFNCMQWLKLVLIWFENTTVQFIGCFSVASGPYSWVQCQHLSDYALK